MVNSIQLQGLTYVRSLSESKTTKKTEDKKFDSVLEEKINTANNTDETKKTSYTNPDDLVCVKSPDSLESYFQEAADTYGVPIALIKAVAKAESDFNPNCVSGAGAQGVMQLMPATAKGLGVKDAFNARENILGGTKYLAKMLSRYDGSVKLALAGYNAGSGNVAKYGGVPPFKETQNYIKKIFGFLGVDLEKKSEETATVKEESSKAENKPTQATLSSLSKDDINDLADAILKKASSNSNSSNKNASELFSQLYGSSDSSNMQSNYSSILTKLLNQ